MLAVSYVKWPMAGKIVEINKIYNEDCFSYRRNVLAMAFLLELWRADYVYWSVYMEHCFEL